MLKNFIKNFIMNKVATIFDPRFPIKIKDETPNIKDLFEISNDNQKISIKSKNGGFIQLSKNNDNLSIEIGGNVDFIINGDLKLTSNGNVDFVSLKDMNIDTWKSKLNINCRKAAQIINEKEAIEYRKNVEEYLAVMKLAVENNKPKKSIDHKHEHHKGDCDECMKDKGDDI